MSLISTYDLREWIGLEEGDKEPNARLQSIIYAVEDFADAYTCRKLEAKRYTTSPEFSYLDGSGMRYQYLPISPVSYVSSVHIDSNREFGSASLLASADFFWYPSGKIVSEGDYFAQGRRNVLVDYIAGYAPISGNTWDSAVSTYPLPQDLKQVMVEMCVESFKEGVTSIHSVQDNEGGRSLFNMLNRNSFWKMTLNKYKDHSGSLMGYEE